MHIFVGETHIFYHFPTGDSFGEPGSLRIENPNDQRPPGDPDPAQSGGDRAGGESGSSPVFRQGGYWETAWYNADAQICPNIIT